MTEFGTTDTPDTPDIPDETTAARILVVDDHPDVHELLRKGLGRAGFQVVSALSGPEALAQFIATRPDVVLLDVLMPGMDGYDLCRRLRDLSGVPIILVSALRNEHEIIHGLDAGADDYVTKPFMLGELTARIRAQLRRHSRHSRHNRCTGAQHRFTFDGGRLQIDLDSRQVSVDGQMVRLGPTEFRLLSYLAVNAGRIVPHREVVEQVWGTESAHLDRYLKIYVQRLRRKIERQESTPRYIVSAHGVGYGFVGDSDTASPSAGRPTEDQATEDQAL